MSRRMAYSLAETIELLLGVAVVLVMLLCIGRRDPFSWGHMLEGMHLPELLTVSVAIWLVEIVPLLVAVAALVWMIRFYLRPDEAR